MIVMTIVKDREDKVVGTYSIIVVRYAVRGLYIRPARRIKLWISWIVRTRRRRLCLARLRRNYVCSVEIYEAE